MRYTDGSGGEGSILPNYDQDGQPIDLPPGQGRGPTGGLPIPHYAGRLYAGQNAARLQAQSFCQDESCCCDSISIMIDFAPGFEEEVNRVANVLRNRGGIVGGITRWVGQGWLDLQDLIGWSEEVSCGR